MAAKEPLFPKSACVGQPGVPVPGPGGRSAVLGREAEGEESPVKRDLLQGIDQGLELVPVIHCGWGRQQPLEDGRILGVVQGPQRRAAGIGQSSGVIFGSLCL